MKSGAVQAPGDHHGVIGRHYRVTRQIRQAANAGSVANETVRPHIRAPAHHDAIGRALLQVGTARDGDCRRG